MPEHGSYVKLSDGLPENDKIVAAGGDAAWLYICALTYASRNRTDGVINGGIVTRISDRKNPAKLATVLVRERLWHESGHDCERCPQPLPGRYVIHDYLLHQRSAAKIAEVSEKRAKSGSRGGSQKAANAQQVASNLPGAGYNGASSENVAPYTETEEVPRTSQTETEAEPPKPPRGRDYGYDSDPDFGRFWAAFPAKAGKPAAFTAWKNARSRGADPEAVIKAAGRYRDDRTRDPAHTKHPQGWLNDERYNDDPGGARPLAYPNSPWEN